MAKNNNFNSKNNFVEPRINYEIKGHSEVRLIYKEHKDSVSENDFNKIVSWREAVSLANTKGLDLIEINSKTTPIIVRLADYSKYLYELKKSMKQKANNKGTTIKEIQLSVNISSHDLEIKANKAKEFLNKGNKVKIVLTMKGRELTRKEDSKKSFYEFIQIMLDSGIAAFDTAPRDEEKKSYVILKKK